jgi:hypothetical protein
VTNVDVVEENIALHGPNFKSDGTHGLQVRWMFVFVEIRVLDLPWSKST